MMVDHISGTHRCSCGRLYKDFTGMMGKCEKCRQATQTEFEAQTKADVLREMINEIEGEKP